MPVRKPLIVQDDKLLQRQSVPVEGEDFARRNACSEELVTLYYDDVTTTYEGFLRGLKITGDGPCLGNRDPTLPTYRYLSYNEVHQRATNAGSGLIHMGCEASQKSFIGIYAQNCVEWVLTDLACQMYSMITVPIYDTHGPEACIHIINHADIKAVVCQAIKIPFLMLHIKDCPQVKCIIKIGNDVTEDEKDEAKKYGIEMVSFADLEVIVTSHHRDPIKGELCLRIPPQPDDICTICYTSGTTGTPKGAIITHKGITASVAGALFQYYKVCQCCSGIEVNNSDVYLSYLPMAHIYEKIATLLLYYNGSRIGFFRGDPKLLLEDIQTLQPTIFAAVPRILNRVYDKVVMAQISESRFKSWLFEKALKSKEGDLKRNVFRGDTLWDKVVFKKIQNLFGGKLRVVTCGSAPLSAKVMMFFKCSLGQCFIVEGYGQTECSAVCCLQFPNDLTAGHVGPPIPCNIIKLVDVPEKNYSVKEGKGEICIKGPNVFKGYLKDPEKTAETIDQDGWLHTGDVGEFLENGTLRIIDRSKHIFKLAQGEYVAPEKIEIICIRSHYVDQIFIHGEGLKSYVIAVVVPDEEGLIQLARQLRIEGDRKFLCKNQEIRKAIFDDIIKKTKEAQLASFEKPKAIYLHPEPFSVENELLTPTFKAKRPAIEKRFSEQMNDLYVEVDTVLKFQRSPSEMSIKLEIDSSKLN
ncbi:hypothetical protein QZH41_010322 [Actinostola sp. cb2023]|nr:hypothetical protein QZH41_010322 [Actinostola sp. cb2023]